MSTQEVPTDAYGDRKVWIESYGDYLPKSDNIPYGPTKNGVSGITHDGEIYCIDCAIQTDLIDPTDLSEMRLDKPWTGLVHPWTETDMIHHCGRHEHCENSTTDHPYDHEEPIGIGIKERAIQH